MLTMLVETLASFGKRLQHHVRRMQTWSAQTMSYAFKQAPRPVRTFALLCSELVGLSSLQPEARDTAQNQQEPSMNPGC